MRLIIIEMTLTTANQQFGTYRNFVTGKYIVGPANMFLYLHYLEKS